MTFIFSCDGNTNSTVKARMYNNDPVIEWDVSIDEISLSDGIGKELVLIFSN